MSDVKLNIAEGRKDRKGWITVPASDGAEYSYKYTGGKDKKGNQEYDADKMPAFFCIVFKGKKGKTYEFVEFNNKTADSDLTGIVNKDGTVIAVTDLCDNDGYFVYGAKVGIRNSDGSKPDVTFECDPVVRNRPGYV